MVNSISVPKEYKHELRNNSSPEYKIATIRDYVKTHPGEVISGRDWYELIGASYPNYLRKLKKQGRLLRISAQDGKMGARYHWKWVDKDYRAEGEGGATVVRSLGFEDWPLGTEHGLRQLANEIDSFLDARLNIYHPPERAEATMSLLNAEEVHGILKFRKFMKERYDAVRKQREEALNNKEESE